MTGILILIAAILPFIAMPLLWRRMKRVREQAYRQSPSRPRGPGWEEPLAGDRGLSGGRTHTPNEELIDLGEKARHGRWPLDNQ